MIGRGPSARIVSKEEPTCSRPWYGRGHRGSFLRNRRDRSRVHPLVRARVARRLVAIAQRAIAVSPRRARRSFSWWLSVIAVTHLPRLISLVKREIRSTRRCMRACVHACVCVEVCVRSARQVHRRGSSVGSRTRARYSRENGVRFSSLSVVARSRARSME